MLIDIVNKHLGYDTVKLFSIQRFPFLFFNFDSIGIICLFLVNSINFDDAIVFKFKFCDWTFILRVPPIILFSFQYFCEIIPEVCPIFNLNFCKFNLNFNPGF